MRIAAAAAATAFVAACSLCSAEGLLANPGFENRDFSGWITSGSGWSIDKDMHSEGKFSALCTVKKGDRPETRACLQVLSGLKPNQVVELSMDVSAINVIQTPHSKASLAVLCIDGQGNVLKEYRANVIKPSSQFRSLKIDDAVVLPGTQQVFATLVVEVYQTASDNDWWRFDNVQIVIH